MFLSVSILLMFIVPFCYTFDETVTGVDMYGKLLDSNEKFVISVTNRAYPIFAIYRPYESNEFCRLDMTFVTQVKMYIMQVALARNGSIMRNRFFFQGVDITNDGQRMVWGRVLFSMAPCRLFTYDLIYDGQPYDYTLFGVSTSGNIYLYTCYDYTYVRDTDTGNFSLVNGKPWPDNNNFIPYTMDVAYGDWGVIAGTVPNSNGIYVPTLYLITFPSTVVGGSYNYVVRNRWQATFAYSWQRIKARSTSGRTDFNPMYGMSLSINNQGDILLGVQSMNTVFLFHVNPTNATSLILIGSRIYSRTIPNIGFGKSVGWLDDTTAVILANIVSLDYTIWYSSQIEIYDLSSGKSFTDTTEPYSSFPTIQQSMYSRLTGSILLMTVSYADSITFMDSQGRVYIILSSPPGYYSNTNVGNRLGTNVYYSSSELCPPGTTTNGPSGNSSGGGKYLFDTCKICPAGTYRSLSSLSTGCILCDTTQYFCPLGAVAEVPLSYLDPISQAVAFPKSPDLTGFEDILLVNMFNINLKTNCFLTTPFFWTLLMIIGALCLLTFVGIFQRIGKCENFQTIIESSFKHFDIIHGGERWISGVLSISIFVLIIFAALFTNSFIKQYPKEKSRQPDFSCDETLRNSQFSSRMQSSGAAISQNAQKIFTLLTSQKFMLIVTLLNTMVDKNITVKQTVGTITTTLDNTLSVPTDQCLTISCNLTANIATITVNISSTQMIGGVRISLSASSIVNKNSEAKELLFANSFTMTNRTMSQEPEFSIELIQIINETRPISTGDESTYTGLWIPIYSQDDDRNFQTESDYEIYHTKLYTILTININQAAYYIYNVEKPIIKTTEVIFKNILFASMCMEILGFGILVIKLAIVPLVRLIIRRIQSKQEEEESKDNNENSDDEEDGDKDKDEDEDEDDDDDVSSDDKKPQREKFGLGKNDWYIPDVKI